MQGADRPDAYELGPTPLQEGDRVSAVLQGQVKQVFESEVRSYKHGNCEICTVLVELDDGSLVHLSPKHLERVKEEP